MVNNCATLKIFSAKNFVWIKPKKRQKTFSWKVWINAGVQKYKKRQGMFFCDETRSVWPQGVTQHRSHFLQVFVDFAQIFSLFSLVFRTLNFWCLSNLMKQLFHSHLLDMRLVIANSALRASLAICHLISNAHSWNNCKIVNWYMVKSTKDPVYKLFADHIFKHSNPHETKMWGTHWSVSFVMKAAVLWISNHGPYLKLFPRSSECPCFLGAFVVLLGLIAPG